MDGTPMKKKACRAKTRKGTPCKRAPMPNGRCNLHGGKTPVGAALPQFKHGRYSRYLPARLADRYLEAESDPELLSLRSELALVQARLAELLGKVDTGEAGALWLAARKAFADLKIANAAGDTKKASEAFRDLDYYLEKGAADHLIWMEIGTQLEGLRRLSESESKRLVAMQQMITAEQAMILLSAVVDVVRQNVSDRGVLAAISAGIGRLMAANAGREDRG